MKIKKAGYKKYRNRFEKRQKKVTWILVETMLPPEPCSGTENEENLEEYIVTIRGATQSSSLKYAGDGIWCEGDTLYPVIAWMPFPEVYRP